jgi:dihydroxy-acid dehydratase
MKLNSYTITQGRDRAPARAMLKAIGFTDEDLKKPIIGVANTWIETMPCNYNLRELAEHVKAGIRAAGGTPMEYNTIAISDGVTMGTEGMKASLVSRDLIADSIELVARGHMFDGVVALVACDKTIPGAAMALLRLNIPGVIMYGGTIMPGHYKGRDLTFWMCSRRWARMRPARCRTRIFWPSKIWRVLEPAPAAASSRPTPWRR